MTKSLSRSSYYADQRNVDVRGKHVGGPTAVFGS